MNIGLSKKQQQLLVGILVVVIGAFFQLFTKNSAPPSEIHPPGPTSFEATTTIRSSQASSTTRIETNAMVVRVVDGDTIDVLRDGDTVDEKVRFLGVNTPETVDPRRAVQCFGKQASNFMKALLTDQRVRLEADPEADEHDKYHRLLRNIILADGTDVNASLVKAGYAYAYVSFPQNKARKKQLLALQEEAKIQKRGLWADDTCAGQK